MKNILLIGLIFFSIGAIAQEKIEMPVNSEVREKIAQNIDALKIAYITKQLNLSPDEAQKFWPIYNNYSTELKKAKIDFKQDELAFEEIKVGIMKKYKNEFKKIFNNDSKINQCFKAEPEFHKLLKAEWIRRRSLQSPNHLSAGRLGIQKNQGVERQKSLRNEHPQVGGRDH